LLHYRAEQRDQIANCMLLTAAKKGFSNKTDTPPAEWFAPHRFDSKEQRARYMDFYLIPDVPDLWRLFSQMPRLSSHSLVPESYNGKDQFGGRIPKCFET